MAIALDDVGVARDPTDPPARHVPALREREDFHAGLLRPGRLQEAGWTVAIEGDLGVRAVVHDDELVPSRQLDHLLKEIIRRNRPGRIVRVVEEEQVGLLPNV